MPCLSPETEEARWKWIKEHPLEHQIELLISKNEQKERWLCSLLTNIDKVAEKGSLLRGDIFYDVDYELFNFWDDHQEYDREERKNKQIEDQEKLFKQIKNERENRENERF